ncbi:MAG TPA: restriction endonuclease subunit S [Spirochaetales bacterium]|jgi:type I restriction enzyme S subunit|nr:restriction endonuclease subunit S [Spirochaetales bacterium]
MSYKPYPVYKDSGIEWLGKIPEGWNLSPLFVILPEHYVQNIGMQSSDVLSLSYGEIIQKDVSDNFGLLPESFETYQLVSPDDIILRLTDLQNDQRSLRTAISSFSGIITSAYIKLRCYQNSSYFHWLLYSADIQKVFYGLGGGVRQSIKYVDLKRFTLVVPPLPTQKAIAAFLDAKTARIDSLVRDYEELIVLLSEKRQALVSHAVTRGLSELVSPDDPDFGEWARPVAFKDSGVEWLGEIPEEWGVNKSRRLFAQRKERAEQSDEMITASQKYGMIFQREFMELEDQKVVQVLKDFDILKKVKRNDFVMSMRSFQGGLELSRIEGCMSSAYIALIPSSEINVEYYKWLFKCGRYIQGLQSTTNLVRDGQALRYDNFVKLELPLLSQSEQKAIAAYLDRETAKLDALVAEAEGAIELLKERRSALITAAVTGKINVEEIEVV